MNDNPSPSWKESLTQPALFIVLTITLVLGIWIRLMGVGWFLVIFGIPLLFLATLHLIFQISAIRRVPKMKPSYIFLILLSNLFFFLGFVLQVDGGDSGGAYVAIVAFYNYYFRHGAQSYIADGQSSFYMYTSLAFLAALIVSWVFLLGKSFLKRENRD